LTGHWPSCLATLAFACWHHAQRPNK
jgi:hypothetical protein